MKKLLITLLLAVLSTSAMAEWVQINANNNSTTYVDPTTIRKVGNKVKMWTMHDYKTMQIYEGKYYLSNKSQFEYDCKNETSASVADLSFSDNMGSGQLVSSYYKNGLNPLPVSPGSIGEFVWKIACGKQ